MDSYSFLKKKKVKPGPCHKKKSLTYVQRRLRSIRVLVYPKKSFFSSSTAPSVDSYKRVQTYKSRQCALRAPSGTPSDVADETQNKIY